MGRLSRSPLKVRARSQSRLLADALRRSAANPCGTPPMLFFNSSPVLGRKQRALFFPASCAMLFSNCLLARMDCTHSNVAVEMARRLMPVAEADNFALGAIHGPSL